MLQSTVSCPEMMSPFCTGYPAVPELKTLRLPPADLRPVPRFLLNATLSNRETEVLAWVARGKTDWEIGAILMISAKTVNFHVERAKRKLQTPTRLHAAMLAVQLGLIEAPVGFFVPGSSDPGKVTH